MTASLPVLLFACVQIPNMSIAIRSRQNLSADFFFIDIYYCPHIYANYNWMPYICKKM